MINLIVGTYRITCECDQYLIRWRPTEQSTIYGSQVATILITIASYSKEMADQIINVVTLEISNEEPIKHKLT